MIHYDIHEIRDGNKHYGNDPWDERKTVYGQLRDLVHRCNLNKQKVHSVTVINEGHLAVIVENDINDLV